MKKFALFILLSVFAFVVKAQTNVLVFSKTNGFRHASIADGQEMFKKLAEGNNWKLTFSEDSLMISNKVLSKIDVLVFLSTTGNIFGADQKKALQKYIHKGGGFVGIHAATDTEMDWKWYVDMVGGAFKSHPKQQNATINIINHDFKAMQHFGKTWLHFDEWYNFRNPINPNAVVLATVDESTYKGGTMGENHPVVWYQNYEGGKIFTTALGHTKESYTNPDFVKMIQEAVVWTGGK
ncbi:MAG TPA: ThuA domain-containing protein [Pelobium sp.]|nr:ThuA domain-containing protein [Pelobium sp.]